MGSPNPAPVPADLGAGPSETPRRVAVGELVAGIVLSAGWIYCMWLAAPIAPDGALTNLAPVWRRLGELRAPILALLLSGIVVACCSLVWPARTLLRSGLRLALDAVGLVLIGLLLFRLDLYVPLALFNLTIGRQGAAPDWSTLGIAIGLYVLAIVTLADMAQEISRMLEKKRWRRAIAA